MNLPSGAIVDVSSAIVQWKLIDPGDEIVSSMLLTFIKIHVSGGTKVEVEQSTISMQLCSQTKTHKYRFKILKNEMLL